VDGGRCACMGLRRRGKGGGRHQATRWQEGSITAKTPGSLRIRGDRRNDIPGDFNADLTLTEGPQRGRRSVPPGSLAT